MKSKKNNKITKKKQGQIMKSKLQTKKKALRKKGSMKKKVERKRKMRGGDGDKSVSEKAKNINEDIISIVETAVMMNPNYLTDGVLNEKGKEIQTELINIVEEAKNGSKESPEEHNKLIEQAIKNVNTKGGIDGKPKEVIIDYLNKLKEEVSKKIKTVEKREESSALDPKNIEKMERYLEQTKKQGESEAGTEKQDVYMDVQPSGEGEPEPESEPEAESESGTETESETEPETESESEEEPEEELEPEKEEEEEDCACPGCGVTNTSDKKNCPFCLLTLERDATMSKKAYVIQEIAQVVNDMYNSILEHIFDGKYTPSNNEKINRVIKDNLRIVSVDKVKKSVLTQLEGFNVMNKTLKDIVDKKNRENQIDVGTIVNDKKCSSDKGMKVEQIKLPSEQLKNSKGLLEAIFRVIRHKEKKNEEDKSDEVKESVSSEQKIVMGEDGKPKLVLKKTETEEEEEESLAG